jgi:D-alanyl-D-alanine carboxypeptidase
MMKPSELMATAAAPSEPIVVYTGPTRTGAALLAAVAADVEEQTPRHHGRKSRVASKRPDNDTKDAESKSADKPARHANAKPDTSKGADKPDAKPAKPKAAAKTAAKPKPESKPESKPAPKNTTG